MPGLRREHALQHWLGEVERRHLLSALHRLLDGEFVAASCEASDNAMRELDTEIGVLRKPAGENVVRLR